VSDRMDALGRSALVCHCLVGAARLTLTAMMYAMVAKVVNPARISVVKLASARDLG